MFFLETTGADSFGKLRAAITWERAKTYREKGVLEQGVI